MQMCNFLFWLVVEMLVLRLLRRARTRGPFRN
jgi:hypothetical protein